VRTIAAKPSQPAYIAGEDGLADEVKAVLAGKPK
jgi:hypothetical protein